MRPILTTYFQGHHRSYLHAYESRQHISTGNANTALSRPGEQAQQKDEDNVNIINSNNCNGNGHGNEIKNPVSPVSNNEKENNDV